MTNENNDMQTQEQADVLRALSVLARVSGAPSGAWLDFSVKVRVNEDGSADAVGMLLTVVEAVDAKDECPGCSGYGTVGGGLDTMPCTDCMATGKVQS